ncbi:Dihydroorotate dehydrogenase B (NAD(+)), electron transfer subunit [Polystyrenella longa]|uniref:Dihydroorotate dehydrogenase B (NAD(+)), electron transfer subunit n=1 Tax=Polystyrenella longa TaxID=2528007 RepID=A0A518CMJ2_9PLAN|nr:dihydroorotate dehydrogenase electron transfer subunit [Polystyrenella longa]QDU80423.1 Dihydroorotate dehydrogenase B (NAD(+)), electron transfer subunit [Polystyrenella longa]
MADNNLAGLVTTSCQQRVTVVEQEQLARSTYRICLRCPDIAKQIVPGQFFMIRVPDSADPLLGRPFALFDVYEENGEVVGLDFGYVVVGKITNIMADWQPGQEVEIWGPLGNGFPEPSGGSLMMIAGGIGQTPFLATAREALGLHQYPNRKTDSRPTDVTLCYGARSKEYLAGLELFDLPGLNLEITTDDGSAGHHGLVTQLLKKSIVEGNAPDRVYTCGPVPMMKAVRDICLEANIPSWLSLETPMACGFGACFSCVTRVRMPDGEWDYHRTCVEGPVFPGAALELD